MKRELLDKINECANMSEVQDIINTLEENKDYRIVDEKIDDGCCEDEDDDYVMKTCYQFFIDEENKTIETDFYWGNNTLEIGWIK